MNELTINVTQFFRDADVYQKLRANVLPDLVKAKAKMGSRTLRVWSAGCASGEEPYSVAILLDQVLGAEMSHWNVRVLGSDFDEKSLAAARVGTYDNIDILEGVEAEKYFEVSPGQDYTKYSVRDEIKRRVRFEKINLLAETEARHFDIVLCRNVLIYFGRNVQSKIIETLSSSILREGYLVLGKSETLGQEAAQLFRPTFPRERIYQLIGDARSGEARQPPASGRGGFGKDR
jgi:chemotaxis protein methyltransferase CheR